MAAEDKKFEVRIGCDYDQWWRYNTYLTVIGYGSDGHIISYNSVTDKVYDITSDASERSGPPAHYRTPRIIELASGTCSYVEVYFYAIANTFPASVSIKDSPPFEITLEVTASGQVVDKSTHEVNQWGGVTIAGLKIGSK